MTRSLTSWKYWHQVKLQIQYNHLKENVRLKKQGVCVITDKTTCFSCNNIKEANSQVAKGTILVSQLVSSLFSSGPEALNCSILRKYMKNETY